MRGRAVIYRAWDLCICFLRSSYVIEEGGDWLGLVSPVGAREMVIAAGQGRQEGYGLTMYAGPSRRGPSVQA